MNLLCYRSKIYFVIPDLSWSMCNKVWNRSRWCA